MTEFNEIRIVDELRKCIESFDDDAREMFDYYCLGKRNNNQNIESYSLDQYLNIVDNCLKQSSNLGLKYVVYKALNYKHNIIDRIYWNNEAPYHYKGSPGDIIEKFSSLTMYSWSCFATAGNKFPLGSCKVKFKFDFKTLNANCCMVFLLHPSVQSYDGEELAQFASVWHEWFHKIIDIYPSPQFKFYFGNRKRIFSGDYPPTHQEIKNNKLNISLNLPIKSIVYEDL